MIETLAKAAEVAGKTLETTRNSASFNPDKRLDKGLNTGDIKRTDGYNPDKRIVDVKPREDGYYTSFEDRVKNTNLDAAEGGFRGSWDGERGNSMFKPSYNYMKETLKGYGLEGIEFVNGEAQFSHVAEATVKIDDMTAERYGKGKNFDQANTKLAERFNEIKKNGITDWNAEKIEEYRNKNKMTWHERCDCETMDLVPTKVHDYFKHSGGVAECKVRDGIGGKFDGQS